MGTRGPKKRLPQHHPLSPNSSKTWGTSRGYIEVLFRSVVCIIRGTGSGAIKCPLLVRIFGYLGLGTASTSLDGLLGAIEVCIYLKYMILCTQMWSRCLG
jgi:hypothetical protein